MSVFLLNTRELRSFKIRKNGLELCEAIKDKNNNIAFAVSYALYTDNRLYAKETLLKQNLKAHLMSVRIFRFLFKTKEWENIKHLLKGQIFLVRPYNTNIFNNENLKFLLNSTQFNLRLMLSNQIFYRKNRLNILMNKGLNLAESKIKLAQDLTYYKIRLFYKISQLSWIK
jgi:hypothetical protein